MKILVCVKQVPDTETKVKISDDGVSLNESEVNFILNPYCEFAVEEALRLREKFDGDVTLVTVGPDSAKSALRSGLAMGADTAVHLKAEASRMTDSFVIAKLLAEEIKTKNADIVFMGKKSVDTDMQSVPSLLGSLLDMAIITAASDSEYSDSGAVIQKEVEGGKEKVSIPYPFILSADKGLNEPRYANLKGIMKAKRKPIDEKDVSLDGTTVNIVSMEYPPAAQPGKIVGEGAEAAPELIRLLREEAKVVE